LLYFVLGEWSFIGVRHTVKKVVVSLCVFRAA
jgi:hypothetical protein